MPINIFNKTECNTKHCFNQENWLNLILLSRVLHDFLLHVTCEDGGLMVSSKIFCIKTKEFTEVILWLWRQLHAGGLLAWQRFIALA